MFVGRTSRIKKSGAKVGSGAPSLLSHVNCTTTNNALLSVVVYHL